METLRPTPHTPAGDRSVEGAVEAFEAAWAAGGRPDLAGFLPGEPTARASALLELVHVELELRLKAGSPARVEEYLARYPELGADPTRLAELVRAEFRLRRRAEPGLTLSEWNDRFPGLELREAESLGGPPSTQPGPPSVPGYEIVGELGRGGMGVVYDARDVRLGRRVALKMVLAGGHAGAEAAARFLREAEAAARLRHPNVVQVYEVGAHAGLPYFTLEYADAGPLTRHARDPLPAAVAARLVAQVARGVAHAHAHGVVHRDLKPENVLLVSAPGAPDEAGTPLERLTPKVTDFGLAKTFDAADELTRSGAVMGTPGYLAPEQAAGDAKLVGPAADVWGLGALLYRLLTGRPPYAAPTPVETVMQVLAADPPAPSALVPKLPRDLETICLKCLRKDPAERYASAAELADDLGRFLAGEPVRARPVGPVERFRKWVRRNRGAAAAAAAVFLALAAGVVAATAFAVRSEAHLRDANRRLTESYLDRGLALCERGDAGQGLLWLAKALAAAERHAPELVHPIRVNLAAWGKTLWPIELLVGNDETVRAVAVSPDGRLLLTGGEDNTARLWDRATGEPVGGPMVHPDWVSAVAFSPDGATFATGCDDKRARLWETATGKEVTPAPLVHGWTVRSVAFRPDGRALLTGDRDGSARLWDVATGAALGRFVDGKPPEKRGPGPWVNAAAFSPDGARVLTARHDGTARLWDAATFRRLGDPLPHDGPLWGAAFSPNGSTFLTRDAARARVWDTATRRVVREFAAASSNHQLAAFRPDGKAILTVDHTGSGEVVRVLDLDTGEATPTPVRHRGLISFAAFTPDGRGVLTGGWDRTARQWGVPPADRPAVQHAKGTTVQAVAFRPDGRMALTGGHDGVVRWWDPATGSAVGGPLERGDEQLIWSAAFSPDGATFLTAGELRTELHDKPVAARATLWDAATGAVVRSFDHPRPGNHRVLKVAFSPNGRTAATGGMDQAARLWDAATGREVGPTFRHGPARTAFWVFGLAYRPDGKVLATGGGDHTARLWDAATGEQLVPPLQHGGPVNAVAFTPDGRTLLTGSHDHSARFWDAATGREVGKPLEHQSEVWAVALSPDGATVLTGSMDRTARLWDVRTRKPLGPPLRHAGGVMAVAFSPDGGTALTGGGDGLGKFWDVPEALAGDAERVALWCQVLTGLELGDDETVRVLDAPAWRQRRGRLTGAHDLRD